MNLLNDAWLWHPLDGDRPRLAGSRCRTCGTVIFPRSEFCPGCAGQDTGEVVPLARRGTLVSFSVAYVAPAGFDPPYAFGYVQLPDGPRVFARLTGCEPPETALDIGMEMELVLSPVRGDPAGEMLWSYAFRPIACAEESHA